MNSTDARERLELCIMFGCDYLDNVKGIGILKILKCYEEKSPRDKVRHLVSKAVGQTKCDEYFRDVELVKYGFLNQVIYDATQKKECDRLRNLYPVNHSAQSIPIEQLQKYTGRKYAHADSFSRGERLFQNENVLREVEKSDFEKLLRFFAYIPKPEFGCFNNLTVRNIGFSNFDDFKDEIVKVKNKSEVERLNEIELIKAKAKKFIADRNEKETRSAAMASKTTLESESVLSAKRIKSN